MGENNGIRPAGDGGQDSRPAGTCALENLEGLFSQDKADLLFGLAAGMTGKDARAGIQVGHGIIDRNGGLAESAGDKFHFA